MWQSYIESATALDSTLFCHFRRVLSFFLKQTFIKIIEAFRYIEIVY